MKILSLNRRIHEEEGFLHKIIFLYDQERYIARTWSTQAHTITSVFDSDGCAVDVVIHFGEKAALPIYQKIFDICKQLEQIT